MEKLKIFFAFALAAVLIFSGFKNDVKHIEYSATTTDALNIPLDSYNSVVENSNLRHDKENLKGVVLIEKYVQSRKKTYIYGSATAFSIRYDEKENVTYFMTNDHVCSMEEDMFLSYIRYDDPIPDPHIHRERTLEIIATDSNEDICILKAYNDRVEPLKIKSSSELEPMDNLYTIGAPAGIYPVWNSFKFSGYVERSLLHILFDMSLKGRKFMLLSGHVIGGQSGSPIYDDSGKVVGIIFATLGDYGGIATPSDTMLEFIDEHLD